MALAKRSASVLSQILLERYLLWIIREMFGPLLDGTDLSLLAVVGGAGIGRVSISPECGKLPEQTEPLEIETLLSAENTIFNGVP